MRVCYQKVFFKLEWNKVEIDLIKSVIRRKRRHIWNLHFCHSILSQEYAVPVIQIVSILRPILRPNTMIGRISFFGRIPDTGLSGYSKAGIGYPASTRLDSWHPSGYISPDPESAIFFCLKPSPDQDRPNNKRFSQIGPSFPEEIGFKHT